MVLPVCALGWLFAFCCAGLWALGPGWAASAVASGIPLATYRWGGKGALTLAAAALVALVGGLCAQTVDDGSGRSLGSLDGHEVMIEGVVDSEWDPGLMTTRYDVRVVRADAGSEPVTVPGKIRVTAGEYDRYLPGTRLQLRGKLEEPPDLPAFDYRGYLARKGVAATMFYPRVQVLAEAPLRSSQRTTAQGRMALERGLARSLPEPEASLAAGIAFGRDGNLPNGLYEDFRRSGTAHMVAVSGSNISLVTGMVFLVLVPVVGRRVAIWPAVAGAMGYVVLAGASASVTRAGIMAGIFLFGTFTGRPQAGLAALAVAAMAMTAQAPGAAFEVGFQLSLAATAGIIVFSSWVRWGLLRALGPRARRFVPGALVSVASLSVCATVATLPLLWVSFGTVSLIGPLANLVVEPLFIADFGLSAATALAAVAWRPAGEVAGFAAYYPLAATIRVAETAAGTPWAAVEVPRLGGGAALVAYGALCLPAWLAYRYLPPELPALRIGRREAKASRLAMVAGSAVLVAVIAVPVSLWPLRGPGELEMTALDIGQGDAILLTTPHGKRILIDGGPSGIGLARELGATLPHWERTLDLVILSHPQQDHVAGLVEVLDRFHAGSVAEPGSRNSTTADRLFQERAPGRRALATGDRWDVDGVVIEVLWPPAGYHAEHLNDSSVVLRVGYGATSFLLTADSEAEVHRRLMAAGPVAADVLKVPHHGSKTSDPAFLTAVGAAVAVIPVGADNRYGHPAAGTLSALQGAKVLRTDERGRITVSSDGRRLRISTQR